MNLSKITEDRTARKLAWITNLPAPYRQPIFEELGRMGIELEVFYIGRDSDGRGWDPSRPQRHKVSSFPLKRLSVGSLETELGCFDLKERLSSFEAVVVGGWDSIFYLQALVACRRAKVRSALFYESTDRTHKFDSGPIAWLRRWALSLPDFIISPGSKAAESARKILPKIQVIQVFNCVDNQHFMRPELQYEPEVIGHKFLFVGRLIELKNIVEIIRAFASIKGPNDTLTVAGFGPLLETLREVAASLGIGPSVEFIGRVEYEELPRIYEAHHTLVLASTNEVWGMVGNESLAMGLHFVVSENCGIAESVRMMDGVFVFKNEEPHALARAMFQSKEAWKGPILKPAIRELATPRLFAEVVATNLGLKLEQ